MSKTNIAKCPKCGCTTEVEIIKGGIIQKVWRNKDDYIIKEETTYEPNLKHSTYECAECGEPI